MTKMGQPQSGKNRSRGLPGAPRRYRTVLLGYSLLLIGILVVAFSSKLGLATETAALVRGLGYALIPASIVGLLYEHALRSSFLHELRATLERTVVPRRGIQIYPSFPYDIAVPSFETAELSIRILQTFSPELHYLLPAIDRALGRVRKLSRKKLKVRILLLNPNSAFVQHRAQDLLVSLSSIRGRIEYCLEQVRNWAADDQRKQKAIEVRLFDGPYIHSVFAADNDIWVGAFLRGQHCTEGPHLLLHANDSYGTAVRTHFEQVWTGASSVDISTGELETPGEPTAPGSEM